MDLKVTVIQADLIWEDVNKNLKRFTEKIDGIKGDTDLIVLPEMFATGFSMKPQKLSEFQDEQLVWMENQAKKMDAVITGSMIRNDGGKYYNSLIWMKPNGTFEFYNKRHLFGFAGEDQHYSQGTKDLIVNLNNWRIKPLICYDLRFPVWSRNKKNYDILIYVANWPDPRIQAWKTLLKARAIENQAYVIAVNRVGDDGNGISHSGDSLVIDSKGNVILEVEPYEEAVKSLALDFDELKRLREKFPASDDADDFEIK